MQRTCLIAAHDPWFIQLLKIYSEECGFRVVQAFDGQEVISRTLHERPAAILLQIDLPGPIQGRDVLKMLRKDANTESLPVIVFSWQGSGDEVIEGATAQLLEPVTYDAFLEALESTGVVAANPNRSIHFPDRGVSPRSSGGQRRRLQK